MCDDAASGVVLFNDLIRPQQQRRRDGEAEGLGGLEVDHQFELRRLFDRKVGGLGAFKNSSDVGSGAADIVGEVRPVRHEPAIGDVVSRYRDRRKPLGRSEFDNPLLMNDVYRAADHKNAVQTLLETMTSTRRSNSASTTVYWSSRPPMSC